MSSCTSCPEGTATNVEGSSNCLQCLPGFYSPGGVSDCFECPERQVAVNPGTASCRACDANSNADVTRTQCLCNAGFAAQYDLDNITGDVITRCVECPKGAVCDFVGAVWDEMEAATGYWETKKDGLISVQLGGETFFCIVTIFAMSI